MVRMATMIVLRRQLLVGKQIRTDLWRWVGDKVVQVLIPVRVTLWSRRDAWHYRHIKASLMEDIHDAA